MEIKEAYKILGLEEDATEPDVDAAYKDLIKQHHPDVTNNGDHSYSLNEARDTLIAYLKSKNDKAIAVVVTNALMKYREADKREREARNEADVLINENSKRPKHKIETQRNLSIATTFFMAIISFIVSSTNSFLDFSYDTNIASSELIGQVLTKDSTTRQIIDDEMQRRVALDSTIHYSRSTTYNNILDSLYVSNATYKKKVDDYNEFYYKQEQKRKNSMIKMMLLLIAGAGGVSIAYLQMRVKRYETDLESFKGKIDNKSKLRMLLRLIISRFEHIENIITEKHLQSLIKEVFYDADNEVAYELKAAISLGKRLELNDLEKIAILKFQEKGLIEEIEYDRISDETSYRINL